MTIRVNGMDKLMGHLQRLGPQAEPALAAALREEGERIMTASKATFVPVDQGPLRASGFVEQTTPLVVTLGYDEVYALAVHENPRAGHTGGYSPSGKKYKHWATVGQWKYLETPFKAAISGMVDRLAATLQRWFDGTAR